MATTGTQYRAQGNLIFDNGLPAAGLTVRLYNIGFAGQSVQLGQTTSDALGNYTVPYTPAAANSGLAPNLQARVLDHNGVEVTISKTLCDIGPSVTMNLIVPSSVQPVVTEFQRLTQNMTTSIGSIANLGEAQEGAERQDLTLLNCSTNWDARLLALAAMASQQARVTGLSQEAMYALFRVGLPTDTTILALVPPATIQRALTKATKAGIVSLNSDQVATATKAFQGFASKTLLATTAPGAVSSFNDLLIATVRDPAQQSAFTNLYFSNPSAKDLWTRAANLNIPADTLNALKLQGKFLHLTFNNASLAQRLQQDIGSLQNLSQMADKGYYSPATWSTTLTGLAGQGGDTALQRLVPPIYSGKATADRVAAYSADLARKVRISFPTQVVARMLEKKEIPLKKTAKDTTPTTVANFLRAAGPLGYNLGRTPLNAFLQKSGKSLPALDTESTQTLKTLHRLFQVTPSSESLQAAMSLGFTSARHISSYTKEEFMGKYEKAFPPGEAELVYGQSQVVSSVTFNFYAMAKQLDTKAPVFALSPSDDGQQNTKSSIVQQFPTMGSLFGNLDFCQCEDCRSVLSPAAYFVDVLEFLRQSDANAYGFTPLDVLVGQRKVSIIASPNGATEAGSTVTITTSVPHGFAPLSWVAISGVGIAGYNGTFQVVSTPTPNTFTYVNPAVGLANSGGGNAVVGPSSSAKVLNGRRPDLAALPLTCENTNTAMPYIDLVNEILEYYIAHSQLDAGAAYDTGDATTADLTAEPQHILPQVYSNTLKGQAYPLGLPFDLWIETVRGFLNYFNTPLAQVLDMLRPADRLELFTDANAYPYYRAQILAEALGLSPAEYGVLTVTDPATQKPSVQNWFKLYGYADEPTALNGQKDPTDSSKYLVPPLSSARNLSQRLGVTYQELTDMVMTGFLNPGLYPLIFQLQRFGIDMGKAFSYTGQPGYAPMSTLDKANFEAQLDAISAQYQKQNFNTRQWLTSLLPANYSTKVLVLDDPNTGCNFSGTVLQYADNATAAAPLDFLKFNLFVRLWKKLGWTMDEVDRALQVFFPTAGIPVWTDPGFAPAFSSAWKTALVYLAHLDDLNTRLAPALGRIGVLPFWTDLPVQGTDPLYSQLFLIPSVLNNDWAFDDPSGKFPSSTSDALANHQTAIQGVLGLTSDEITAILADAGAAVKTTTIMMGGQNVVVPSFSLTNLSICYRYSLLAQTLQLSVSDLIALKSMSGPQPNPGHVSLNPFTPLKPGPLTVLADDVLYNQTLLFVKQVNAVQNSGFSVADLKYLLRQQFDPVGPYQSDPNALMALVQNIANGLQQIQTQSAVPANLAIMSEALIDQRLSTLLPVTTLKNLFTLLANSQTITASQGGVLPANQIDPTPFAGEPKISFAYDPVTGTQSVSFHGLLLDWKKNQLLQINNSALFSGLLAAVQQQTQAALAQSIGNVLGVWASLVEYEAVQTGTTGIDAASAAALMQKDSALRLSYDGAGKLQWLGYYGALTDAKKAVLTAAAAAMPASVQTLLASLLNDVQQQALPAYSELVSAVLADWVNTQSYQSQTTASQAQAANPTVFFSALDEARQKGAISNPPVIQLSYDPVAQIETMTVSGVVTEDMRGKLAGLMSGSAVLAALLNDVRKQALTLFQTLATNILMVAATDLDKFCQPFLGLAVAQQRTLVKAELLKVFLPLLARKLSRQLVLQTLSANLASDPGLTEALVTDAALLTDPSDPGKSLLDGFLAVGRQGVSASFYTTPDQSGPQASGTAATTDTADPAHGNLATQSAHFEGFLQVPTDGPYRFFAELGNQNAQVTFQLDSPDPTALFSNPIVQAVAAKDGDEASQFVTLKGGAPYHFTLDLKTLGKAGAKLLIEGETVPKGPLNQIMLYSEEAITRFGRARILLSKALQIMQVTGLDLREIAYLTANAAQFNNLKLSALPTQPSDDSPANAITLFSQFLTLADYADLRKGAAGGSDGLIDVFANVGEMFTEAAASQDTNNNPAAPWTSLANLTRRDAATVRAIAKYFGFVQEKVVSGVRQVTAVGDFGDNLGLRRLWQALQLLQIVRLPVASLTAATAIVSTNPASPDLIAANLKNAVKAQYTPDSWRPIAQSVFDPLRRKKRDALVAYLVNSLALENSNQLFEYFLIDPGMEPVVQTSRIRLAMSSVQTFIQRCLLNLENGNHAKPERNVAPNAINASWWEWMKRYRVWEANREIFLYPENWMEPELRLDKTDLFEALESNLLQGDVTSDLANDAFLTYLKGLDVRARLDIVASYLDQDVINPGLRTLHVLGRTYGHPHKYFYRTYSNGLWSGWIPVTPEIDGNHIVLVVWQGRLNIFWATFIKQNQPPQKPGPAQANDPVAANIKFNELAGDIFTTALPQAMVQIQLHWVEYFQGKWSNRISSNLNKSQPIPVPQDFVPNDVLIHVSKEVDSSGNEGAVKIHLDTHRPNDGVSFRVTSKNCDPAFDEEYWLPAPEMVYNMPFVDATLYTGTFALFSEFESQITDGGTGTLNLELILDHVNDYALLPCANPVAPPFLNPNEPLYWEAGALVSPFFYKDAAHPSNIHELTFFVQPSLTEQTVETWYGWAVPPEGPVINWSDAGIVDKINVVAQVQASPAPVNPGDPQLSVFPMQNLAADWAVHAGTLISYHGALIGKGGGITQQNVGSASTSDLSPGSLAGSAISAAIVSGAAAFNVLSTRGLSLSHMNAVKTSQRTATTVNAAPQAFKKTV